MRRHHLIALVTTGLLGSVGAAHAHAHIRSATPGVDSTVAGSPAEVAITFSEGVEPAFSSITVQDSTGRRVDTGDAHTAPGDNKLLSVGLTRLAPGAYVVTWHATAVDTHKTEGKFGFTVAP